MVSEELRDILIADVALTIAFAVAFLGGIFGLSSAASSLLVTYIVGSFIAVSFSFFLHEYMHKLVAQRYGAVAAFRRSDTGIMITLLTGFSGILIGLPGATVIYTNTFTKKEEGYVSLAGPVTNFAIFILFLAIYGLNIFSYSKIAGIAISLSLFISIWLAFVNMLPIYPMDGSKVLRWNKVVYAITLAVILGLLVLYASLPVSLIPRGALIEDIIFVLIIAFIMSYITRGVIFRQLI